MDVNDCACGHAHEEHGGDPKYPGSSACQVEDCGCIAWERGEAEPPKASRAVTSATQQFKRRSLRLKQQPPRKA
jgi:hypothetical protein